MEPAEVVSEAAHPHPVPETHTVASTFLCPKTQAKEWENGANNEEFVLEAAWHDPANFRK